MVTVLLVLAAGGVSGCGWRGLNSLPLPGTKGHGAGAYTVYIQMPDVATLTRNAQVRVADVTVGRVADLRLQGDHALVTVRLDGDVRLPGNATAKIGQASLLGAAQVELAAPVTEPAEGTLHDGDTIPLARSGDYPTTEQTLSSLSLVLNGGGIGQIQQISRELNTALSGRQDQVRGLLAHLDTVLTGLDAQKSDIVAAIDGLDRLSAQVAQQNDVLADSISALRPALTALSDRRDDLTTALDQLGALGDAATRAVHGTRTELVANLRDLQPVLKGLADSGSALTESTRYLLTFPFPIDTYANAVRGDYANGEVTLDLRVKTLDNALLLGTGLQGALAGLPAIIGKPEPPTAAHARGLGQLLSPAPASAGGGR
ncbi:MCE family protein [Speluncibacter jeojiensis]|uniref:MCE family protein n=1 Tax=Speluncibacter jeojiensis TaxID=2710754 RepID=UPI00240ED2B4|nr:MCE family protein [Rhodococcus sp. D2-41]